jgi:hypothetical protein
MNDIFNYVIQRIGKITSSEGYKLLGGGKRAMTESELLSRDKSDKRTTVDTLFGEGAMNYLYTKVSEHLTGEGQENFSSAATDWGNEHEPIAAERLRSLGHSFEYYGSNNPKFFELSELSGGSPDCLGSEYVYEIKCPYSSKIHLRRLLYVNCEDLKREEIEIYTQCQMNMLSCKRNNCYFVSFDPRFLKSEHQIFVLEVPKDDIFCDNLQNRINEGERIIKDTLEVLSSCR